MMRALFKWLGRGLLAVAVVIAGLFVFGPYEPVEAEITLDPAAIAADPASYLAARESRFDDIRPGLEKQIVWAGAPGAKTPLTVVYFHGFSASANEIRPVPDRVAEGLGANLVFTRFAGHGRSSEAMGEARAGDWIADAAEAMEVARAVGDEVLIISTSTGGTLAALTALDRRMSRGLKGIVFVAPNFGINNPAAPLLTLPAARHWLPVLFGDTRSYQPNSDAQAASWTTAYPSTAVLPLAALVKYTVAQDFSRVTVPALFYFSDHDKVVVPARTHEMTERWGGTVTRMTPRLGPQDDPNAHVITGDIISPGTTDNATRLILDWAQGL
jgi:esterase/lipase